MKYFAISEKKKKKKKLALVKYKHNMNWHLFILVQAHTFFMATHIDLSTSCLEFVLDPTASATEFAQLQAAE